MATRYWIGGTGNWGDTSHWSDATGGNSGATVPTAVDNVFFNSGSGTGTVTVNVEANMLDLTFSGISAMTLSNAVNAFNVFGSLTLHANLTVNFTGTGYWYMKATDSRTITSNGFTAVSLNRLTFDGVGGTWINQDTFNVCKNSDFAGTFIYLNSGTWDTNNQEISVRDLYSSTINTKSLILGSSIFNAISFNLVEGATGLTFNKGTSTIKGYAYCGLAIYSLYPLYKAIIPVGNWNSSIRAPEIDELYVEFGYNYFGLYGKYFTVGNTLQINNVFSVNINSLMQTPVYRLLLASNNIGVQRTIICNGVFTAHNLDLRDINLAGTCNKDLSAITGGSGDCGGNSGITFTTAQPQYYKHVGTGTTLWSDAIKWFSDSGLTILGRVPLPQDDANFIAGSFTQACTLSVNVPRIGRSLDMSSVDKSVTFTLATNVENYGKLLISTGITCTDVNLSITICARENVDLLIPVFWRTHIYWGFGTLTGAILSGIVTLQANFNSNKTFGSGGIWQNTQFNFNGYDVTCDYHYIHGGYGVKNYGSGTHRFNRFYSYDISSPRSIHNGYIIATNITHYLAGTSFNKLEILNSCEFIANYPTSFQELILTSGKTYRFNPQYNPTWSIKKLNATGTLESPITLTSTSTTPFNITKAAPLDEGINCDYLNVSYSTATPEKAFFAGYNSTISNSTGWIQDYQYRYIIVQPNKTIIIEEGTGRILW